MKRILLFITIFISFIGCKDQQDVFIDDNQKGSISSLRADFENQTGYKGSDKYFLIEGFRSEINWKKTVNKGNDTTYIKVNVLDTVQIEAGNQLVDIGNYVWIRAVKDSDKKINYTLLMYTPETLDKVFNGLILKKKIGNKDLDVSFISESRRISKAAYLGRVNSGVTRAKSQKVRASGSGGCVTGYVNGAPSISYCPSSDFDSGEDNTGGGQKNDGATDGWYDVYPVYDGGGTEGTPAPPSKEDKEIIDSLQGYPCAQAVLAKLPNLKNKISAWLSKEFNKSIENDITFRVSTKLDASVDGVWNNNNGSGTVQTISLNANMLSKASQEYIAATMFHEALHGFLYMEEQRLKNEGKASQFGILYPGFTEVNIGGQVRFVKKHSEYGTLLDDLAAALRSFNPNMSDYDAMALSKVGVVKDFNDVEKGTVINHRDGNYGTTCK